MNTISHTRSKPQRQGLTSIKLNLRFIIRKLDSLLLRRKSRRELAKLPDYLLKDIGVTRAEALRESDKSFWQS
ncbi:DUF1127 domain-containing protein [Agarivorans sp. Alg241-V36]|uniref:DUF1127 domain-containing protein n=1 Tax=Agarivorans sp. Alg241-V36 TaxID=2305992 RepID=UPI0013D569B7|nr:DUF1127 domain-containing protein [Agarivorans sp. Alg241-V36]